MWQYKEMLQYILDKGVKKPTRAKLASTGEHVNAISVFGYQNRYDLSEGFPILTTKKIGFKTLAHELIWFLRGDTNTKYLEENNVKIWKEWTDKNGDVGPLYPKQWTAWENISYKQYKNLEPNKEIKHDNSIKNIGKLGNYDKNDPILKHLLSVWRGLLQRCYNKSRKEYKFYGEKGIHVDKEWLIFENFQKDVKQIPGWYSKLAYPNLYSLDKDYYCTNRYSKETCIWSSDKEQKVNNINSHVYKVVKENGEVFYTMLISEISKNYNLDHSSIYKCIKRKIDNVKGWKFYKIKNSKNFIPRLRLINQIHEIIGGIKSIKSNPRDSIGRRLLISAWNVSDLKDMKLAPCHCLAQFSVVNNKLSCQLYQRSSDCFLGVPFNISSYALLTNILAHLTGLQVGEFIHTFGDLHIYENHLDQVNEQLTRPTFHLPTLVIKDSLTDINKISIDDFYLSNYDYNKKPLKGEVAV